MCLALLLPLVSPLRAQEAVTAQAYRTVNVRNGPGTQYPIITQLDSGQVVQVVGRNDDESNWLLIEEDGVEGWIAYFTVNVIGDLSILPIIEDIEPSEPLPLLSSVAEAENGDSLETPQVTAFRAVNVRTAPSVSSSRLGALQPGESAVITARTGDTEWLRIDFDGQEAWIAFFVVNVTGNLEPLPVIASIETLQTQAAATEQALEVTTRFNANLRTTPNRTAELMAVIPYSTQLSASARSESGDWIRVEYDGMIGWLVTSLVTIDTNDDLKRLPVEPV